MNLNEEEVMRKGNRLGCIVLIIIGIVVISSIIVIVSIYKMFTSPIPRKYYVLDVNDNNKEEVIQLFENEKENIFRTEKYCDSIYKIEYYNTFAHGTDYTMYCMNEENISFGLNTSGINSLAKYIRENGYAEKR